VARFVAGTRGLSAGVGSHVRGNDNGNGVGGSVTGFVADARGLSAGMDSRFRGNDSGNGVKSVMPAKAGIQE
jgi:hypothetical protein